MKINDTRQCSLYVSNTTYPRLCLWFSTSLKSRRHIEMRL